MRRVSKHRYGSKEVYIKYRSRNKNKIYSLTTRSQSNCCCKKRVNKFNYVNNSTIYSKTFYSSQSTEVFPVRINVSRFFKCIQRNEEYSEEEQRAINYSEYKISSDKGVNSFLKIPVSWSYNIHKNTKKEKGLTKEQFGQVKECIELVKKIKDSNCFKKGSEGCCKIDKILSLVSNEEDLEKNRMKLMKECAELAVIIKVFFENNGFPVKTFFSLLHDTNISTKYKIKQTDEPPERLKEFNINDSLTEKQLKQIIKYTELVHRVKSFKEGQHEMVNSKIIKDKYKILEKTNANDDVKLIKQCNKKVKEISRKTESSKKSDDKTKEYLQVGKLIKGILDYFNIFKVCSKGKTTKNNSKEKQRNNHNKNIDVNKVEKERNGENGDIEIKTRNFDDGKLENIRNIQNCFRVDILSPKLTTTGKDEKFAYKDVSKQIIIPRVKVNTLITQSEKGVTAEKSDATDHCECCCQKCNELRNKLYRPP